MAQLSLALEHRVSISSSSDSRSAEGDFGVQEVAFDRLNGKSAFIAKQSVGPVTAVVVGIASKAEQLRIVVFQVASTVVVLRSVREVPLIVVDKPQVPVEVPAFIVAGIGTQQLTVKRDGCSALVP